ncbi:TPA: hypothetical protein ACX6RO_001897 [Photobacterium damselae]
MSKFKSITAVIKFVKRDKPRIVNYQVVPLLEVGDSLLADDKSRSFMADFYVSSRSNFKIRNQRLSLQDLIVSIVKDCYLVQKKFDYEMINDYSYHITSKSCQFINRENSLCTLTPLYPNCHSPGETLTILPYLSTEVTNRVIPFKTAMQQSEDRIIIKSNQQNELALADSLMNQIYTNNGLIESYALQVAVFIDSILVASDIDDDAIRKDSIRSSKREWKNNIDCNQSLSLINPII